MARRSEDPLERFRARRLAELLELEAQVVKQKFFVGLSNAETAAVLGISEKTVNRHWTYAKAWLFSRIQGAV